MEKKRIISAKKNKRLPKEPNGNYRIENIVTKIKKSQVRSIVDGDDRG